MTTPNYYNPQQQGQPYPLQPSYNQAQNYGTQQYGQPYPQQYPSQNYQQQADPSQYPQQSAQGYQQPYQAGYPQQYQQPPVPQNSNAKSRITAALLAAFLTWVGAANFYLGYKEKAIAQLVLGCFGWILGIFIFFVPLLWLIPAATGTGIFVWAIVDLVYILDRKPPMDRDANGIPLID